MDLEQQKRTKVKKDNWKKLQRITKREIEMLLEREAEGGGDCIYGFALERVSV